MMTVSPASLRELKIVEPRLICRDSGDEAIKLPGVQVGTYSAGEFNDAHGEPGVDVCVFNDRTNGDFCAEPITVVSNDGTFSHQDGFTIGNYQEADFVEYWQFSFFGESISVNELWIDVANDFGYIRDYIRVDAQSEDGFQFVTIEDSYPFTFNRINLYNSSGFGQLYVKGNRWTNLYFCPIDNCYPFGCQKKIMKKLSTL